MKRACLQWIAGACLAMACAADSAAATVILNVSIVDGTGASARPGAVRIVGDKIAAVGTFAREPDDRVIDGGGLVLAPGFIDTHSHHDRGLFEHRDAIAMISQGVTTIVVGQDGFSSLPLADFFNRLAATPVAVNVASYSGHNTLRAATSADIVSMSRLLEADMDAGALGLSTGLAYEPGIFSTREEVIELAKVAARRGGRYISHIRNENVAVFEAVEEAIEIARQARLPVQVSHVKIGLKESWGQAERLLATLERARAQGAQITADVYPYTYWQTTMRLLFEGDERNSARVAWHFAHTTPPETLILQRYLPEPSLENRSIAALAQQRSQDPVALYVELARRATEYEKAHPEVERPVESVIGTSMAEQDVQRLLQWDYSNICSDGTDGGHPRGYGSFTRVLGEYVRERHVLTLEQAVRKMTALAVANLGLADRGAITRGAHADLVLFDPAVVGDRATVQEPKALSAGIVKVWVAGELVYENGRTTGRLPGRVIRAAR